MIDFQNPNFPVCKVIMSMEKCRKCTIVPVCIETVQYYVLEWNE